MMRESTHDASRFPLALANHQPPLTRNGLTALGPVVRVGRISIKCDRSSSSEDSDSSVSTTTRGRRRFRRSPRVTHESKGHHPANRLRRGSSATSRASLGVIESGMLEVTIIRNFKGLWKVEKSCTDDDDSISSLSESEIDDSDDSDDDEDHHVGIVCRSGSGDQCSSIERTRRC